MSTRLWPPHGCGAGLRSKHYPFILKEKPAVDWFEAVTENYLDTGGRPLATLEALRAHYPVALHGVSLSIGSCDELDAGYLKKLKALVQRIEPFAVSDHLCWTGVDGRNLHDLLPLPFTEEALTHVVRRIQQVQEFLGRPILLENISTYISHDHSTMPEWEFLRETARRSGCGILLDLNNVYVNAANHGFDPARYLEQIPGRWVGQFHLAGHTDKGTYLFDTHSTAVTDDVWALYRRALELYGPVSTLVEWDEAIPDFPRLEEEVQKAKAIYVATGPGPEASAGDRLESANLSPARLVSGASGPGPVTMPGSVIPKLLQVQRRMSERILDPGPSSKEDRLFVYSEAYLARMAEALGEVYEAVGHLLGKEAFIELVESYIGAYPSRSYNLNLAGETMPAHIARTRFAEKLPFLPDLARLEWRIGRAFHAFERDSFDPTALSSRTEQEWERLRVSFQPSVAVVRSEWPVLDIWNARKTPAERIDLALEGRPQNVLVWRRGLEVVCELLDGEQAEWMHSLLQGEPLGEVCAKLAGGDVGGWFSSWAARGLIAGVA